MVIGVPKEIKNNEFRVALVPAGVRTLVSLGHRVFVQRSAGEGSGIHDEEYIRAGAIVVDTGKDVYERAEMVIKVKEPLPQEYGLIEEDQIIFGFLHLAATPELIHALIRRKCVGIAYETVQLDDGLLPLLTPMSEVAGRLAPQVGAHCLEKAQGGRGVLMGGVPGVERARVTILGAGVVGSNAAKIALGLGAEVYLLDVNPRRLAYLDDIFGTAINTVISNYDNIAHFAADSDLVIGAVLIPGALTPIVVDREIISTMRPRSVVVDVSIDQGGCFETSKPTTHETPTYIVEQVIHYCVTNIPAAVPRTSTFALTNATFSYILEIANKGFNRAIKENHVLARGVNIYKGAITHPSVAKSQDCRYEDLTKFFE